MARVYKTKKYPPEKILTSLGFLSANRGYVLPRARGDNSKHHCQIHALVDYEKNEIQLHKDYIVGKKHVSSKKGGSITFMVGLFRKYENEEPIELTAKQRKKYPTLTTS